MLTPLGKQDAYPTWQAGCLLHLEMGKSMHRIRLREPWAASLNAESGAIVYARKFHKPTDVNQQSIALQVALLHKKLEGQELEGPETILAVLLNGRELLADLPAENRIDHALHFQLTDLQTFNSLELCISGANGTTGPSGPIFDATSIPTFGSFVIESVELQIE
jgi:hypothetical protein